MDILELNRKIKKNLIERAKRNHPVHLSTDNEAWKREFERLLDEHEFVGRTFVEQIPYYSQSEGTTLASLSDGESPLIERETAELFSRYFGCAVSETSLYEHQKASLDAVLREKKNLVVCTGTGSGKTESFLIPVINELIREHKEKGADYRKGVRALILYPMNALVNDQALRLRNILKCAAGISGAEDITFGYLSSVVKDVSSTTLPQRLLESAEYFCRKEASASENEVRHRYLSEDDSPACEYTTRKRWKQEPADILITNYVMLENMMMDPDWEPVFRVPENANNHFRFVILDEAHSYDGAVGTEIALLLRRLEARLDTNLHQYIATSATLVEGSGDEAIRQIRDDFASCLFPAGPDTFSVQMGSLFQTEVPVPATEGETDYGTLNCQLSDLDRSELIKYFPDELCKSVFKPEMTLLELTSWFYDVRSWYKQVEPLTHIKRRSDSKLALGDAVALSNIYVRLKGQEELVLRWPEGEALGKMRDFLREGNNNTEEEPFIRWKNQIEALMPGESRSRKEDAARFLENFSQESGEAVVHLKNLPLLAYSLDDIYDRYFSASDVQHDVPTPSLWLVDFSDDVWEKVEEFQKKIRGVHEGLQKVEKTVNRLWSSVLGYHSPDQAFSEQITQYILAQPHFGRLQRAFRELPLSDCTLKEIAGRVFPGLDSSEKRLVDFTNLISLSKHPSLPLKPLMDLRFHETVSGLSNVCVWFTRSAEGQVLPHLVENEEKQYIEYEGEEYALFNLGVCYDCYYPFILGFAGNYNENVPRSISRYSSSNCNILQAYTWIQPNQGESSQYHLDIKTGRVTRTDAVAMEGNIIPLYVHSAAPHDNEIEKRKHISTCPMCNATQNQPGEYAQLGPYRTGDDIGKVVVLETLVSEADADMTRLSLPGKGKKVLAFSDSRSGAARLAINFEKTTELNILEGVLARALSSYSKFCAQDDNGKAVFDKLMDYAYEGDFCRFKLDHRLTECFEEERWEDMEWVRENVLGWEKYSRFVYRIADGFVSGYVGSFRALVSFIGEEMVASAPHLSEREYNRIGADGEETVCVFSEGDSAILSILSCVRAMREVGSEWLLLDSAALRRDPAASQFIKKYGYDLFRALYFYLLKYTCLYCENLSGESTNYVNEVERVLDNGRQKYLVVAGRVANAQYNFSASRNVANILHRYGYNDNAQRREILDTFVRLCISKSVLKQAEPHENGYVFNVNDVRFGLKEQLNEGEQASLTSVLTGSQSYYRIEEHTAQLSSSKSRTYQNQFAQGDINILSSSTTFEMGVDLGKLNIVFLNNLPPATENYKQRAGRAGRRPGSSSFVITYLSDHRPHDCCFKGQEEKVFFGPVRMPLIKVEDNPVLWGRHLRAEALHFFLKWVTDRNRRLHWKISSQFFLGYYCGLRNQLWELRRDNQQPFVSLLREWMADNEQQQQLQCHIRRIVRGIAFDFNVDVAADLCYHLLGASGQLHNNERIPRVQKLDATLENLPDAPRNNGLSLGGPNSGELSADRLRFWNAPALWRFCAMTGANQQIRYIGNDRARLFNQHTIRFLAKNKVLPGYGFANDVIDLLPADRDDYARDVDLSRPAQLAIFEFAPGQTVIADKRVYKSSQAKYYIAENQAVMGANGYRLCRCGRCNASWIEYVDNERANTCVYCASEDVDVEENVCKPDAFKCNALSTRARHFNVRPPQRQEVLFAGRIKPGINIANSKVAIAPVQNSEIIYLHRVGSQVFYYDMHTDVVLIRPVGDVLPTDWNDNRRREAWISASVALARAAAELLGVPRQDVGCLSQIMPNEIGETSYYLILFDKTPSGSGAFYRLGEEKRSENILKMLNLARRNLRQCDCLKAFPHGKSGWMSPVSYEEYMFELAEAPGQNHRLRQACPHCLKSFDNQFLHEHLDAYDADCILCGLLGSAAERTEEKEGGQKIGSAGGNPVEDFVAIREQENFRDRIRGGFEFGNTAMVRGETVTIESYPDHEDKVFVRFVVDRHEEEVSLKDIYKKG